MNFSKFLYIIFTYFIFFAFNSFATPDVSMSEDGKIMIIGECSWDEWQKATNWESANDNLFSQSGIDSLKQLVDKNNISFYIFAGSWCGDSKSELPKIIKLFQLIKLNEAKYKLFGVDRSKLEPSNTSSNFSIERVPTLIILSNGNEIGRIVEYPTTSWIDDINRIILSQR